MNSRNDLFLLWFDFMLPQNFDFVDLIACAARAEELLKNKNFKKPYTTAAITGGYVNLKTLEKYQKQDKYEQLKYIAKYIFGLGIELAIEYHIDDLNFIGKISSEYFMALSKNMLCFDEKLLLNITQKVTNELISESYEKIGLVKSVNKQKNTKQENKSSDGVHIEFVNSPDDLNLKCTECKFQEKCDPKIKISEKEDCYVLGFIQDISQDDGHKIVTKAEKEFYVTKKENGGDLKNLKNEICKILDNCRKQR